MTYEEFLQRVGAHGIVDRDGAEKAIEATLTALGQRLPNLAARAVADRLPDGIGGVLRRQRFEGGGPGLEAFYEEVARVRGVDRHRAIEEAQVVCRAVSEALDDEAHAELERHLPRALLLLFQPPEHGAPPPRPGPAPKGRTLADGRPGASRPLSEARPAQRDSVARTDEPYADTSLATTRGTTQERLGDTLAEGRPGSKHPVSDSD